MLYYLIAVNSGLLVAALLCGVLYGFVDRDYDVFGRRTMAVGLIVGAVAAMVMSYLKNKTSLIHTGIWNLRIFTTSTVLLLIFVIFLIPALRRKAPKLSRWVLCLSASLLTALLLFYSLPDVYAYPFIFRKLYSETVFSTSFLYRFSGYVLGLILMVLCFFAARYTAEKSDRKTATILSVLALCANAAQQIGKIIATMLTRRYISAKHPLYHQFFEIAKFTSNHSNVFVYLVVACMVLLAVILIARSLNVHEPYDNPAQHRKIKAKWRSCRRWAVLLLICCACGVFIQTVLYAIENRPPELAEAEEFVIENDEIYISFAQVDDGNLHRFAYVTPNKIETRFIIIKKPNSSAYGIGLDACDICGQTGYYQRGDQVVCNRCDVVMNINTIGFKGGCNPIPIDYRIADGYIIVPISTLIEHESEFK